MGNQTTKTTDITFGDGCKISITDDNFSTTTDLGAMRQGSTATFTYDETKLETGNAGELNPRITNMKMAISFDLLNVNPDDITVMAGGVFTATDSTGAISPADQTVAAGWTAKEVIHLLPYSGTVLQKFTTTPVITSIEGSDSGACAENDDFFVFADPESPSGYSVYFVTTGTATLATTEVITIDYGSNTMVSRTTITAGATSATMTPIGIRIVHTDENGKEMGIDIYSVTVDSGAFQFMWKGANEDDANSMPFTLTGKIDTSRTTGAQLFSFWKDLGYSA